LIDNHLSLPGSSGIGGVLVIDKPPDWTSHDVVAKIRNITKIKKVGHTGTLDPFATGVLPLTLGRATRLTDYFLRSDKIYRGLMRFGYATATFDLEGDPLSEDTRPVLDPSRLQEVFLKYVGTVRQTLPPYSAKKVHGKPLYSYARKGVKLEPTTKEVVIKSLALLGINESEVEFQLECAAGTYARSLAHDIGRDYGCGAHLISLRRTRSGEFPIEAALPLSDGKDFFSRDYFLAHIIPMSHLLTEIPAIVISPGDRQRVIHGTDLNLLTSSWETDEYRLVDESGDLIALARRLQTFVSPVAQPVHWVRVHPHVIFS
jgi:tRNA pseudouridine55 synthase